MQKYFEKIIERLEDTKGIAFLTLANTGDKMKDVVYDEVLVYMNTAIEIVNQVAEEYGKDINAPSNDGWIPCDSGKMPEREEACWITFEDAYGKLHVGQDIYCDYGGWYETADFAVKAWIYINTPAPYQPKGE